MAPLPETPCTIPFPAPSYRRRNKIFPDLAIRRISVMVIRSVSSNSSVISKIYT